MKKILSVLAVLAMAVTVPQNAKAYDFTYTYQGKLLYYNLQTNSLINQTYAVVTCPVENPTHSTLSWVGFAKPTGQLVIPDSVEWNGTRYAVKELGEFALCTCDSLTSVTIPQGVFSIGLMALGRNTRLESVVLPNNLIFMGEFCFYGDESLSSIDIPASVGVIPNGAFERCSSLQTVIVPEGITRLEQFAFEECGNLVSIQFPSTLTFIGGACFQDDSALVSVNVPAAVDTIHQWAFFGCTNLQSITLHEGLKFIGMDAFDYCESLHSITFPSTLDSIGMYAFWGCYSLDSVLLPDGMKHVSEGAFGECPNLKYCPLPSHMEFVDILLFYGTGFETIEVPEGVTYIDTAAFGPCPVLHKVTLPSTLVTLRDFAFQYDTLIDTIILRCAVPPATPGDSVFTYFAATLIVPCGTADDYRQHEVWGRFPNVVEDCNAIDGIESNDINVYVRDGRIVVDGADGETVRVYDMMGRETQSFKQSSNQALPTGVYMVQVGASPARKVLVVR